MPHVEAEPQAAKYIKFIGTEKAAKRKPAFKPSGNSTFLAKSGLEFQSLLIVSVNF